MYKVNYFSLEKQNEDIKSITFHSKKKNEDVKSITFQSKNKTKT